MCRVVVLLSLVCGCSSLSRADRVRYGLEGIKAACEIYVSYPAEVPRQPELDEICPALELAGGE